MKNITIRNSYNLKKTIINIIYFHFSIITRLILLSYKYFLFLTHMLFISYINLCTVIPTKLLIFYIWIRKWGNKMNLLFWIYITDITRHKYYCPISWHIGMDCKWMLCFIICRNTFCIICGIRYNIWCI
jgi:hypothetical protein